MGEEQAVPLGQGTCDVVAVPKYANFFQQMYINLHLVIAEKMMRVVLRPSVVTFYENPYFWHLKCAH